MFPLALLAVLIYTNGIQLVLFLRKGNIGIGHDSEWLRWIHKPETAEGRVGEIIRYTLENVRTSRQFRNRFEEVRQSILHDSQRSVTFLNSLIAAAPLMGLLGTVIGMLTTFSGIAEQGGGDTVDLVASGVSEALITTQTGLAIALPGIFLVLIIRNRVRTIEAALARLESLSLTKLRPDQ